VADEPAALVWAANFGALEWHPWTSRTEAPECPTYALFDIDPGSGTTWEQLLQLARLHRTAFEQLDVRAQPKVSGRRGIQVVVPIAPGPSFDETRAWVERVFAYRRRGRARPGQLEVAEVRAWRTRPARLHAERDQQDRRGAVLTRPAPGAPVSAPIGWHELDDPALRPDRWTIRTVLERLAEQPDPFLGVLVLDQELPTFA